jgi:hypothetical protein
MPTLLSGSGYFARVLVALGQEDGEIVGERGVAAEGSDVFHEVFGDVFAGQVAVLQKEIG